MQNLHCVMCGVLTEAHDYADAIICDSCSLPTEESSERESEKDAVQSDRQDGKVQPS